VLAIFDSFGSAVYPRIVPEMHEITQKFRHLLRQLLYFGLAITLAAGTAAAALPWLIEGGAIRDAFVRSLSAWSGGKVELDKKLRVVSFTGLSIEASGVHFANPSRLSPIARLDAKSVSATVRLSSLLLGRLEFKKVSMGSARVALKRQTAPFQGDSYVTAVAANAASFARLSSFQQLELKDSALFVSKGSRRPYERLSFELLRVDKASAGATGASDAVETSGQPVTFQIRDPRFQLFFRGYADPSTETAFGTVRIKAPADSAAAARIIRAVAPWESGRSIGLTGDLALIGGRAALDDATLTFGDHAATGSIAFATRQGRPLLEGTLAFDRLNLPAGVERAEAGAVAETYQFMSSARSGDEGPDLDMRISAERLVAGSFETGSLALALTSQKSKISVDIVELAVFGGQITGRIEYDPNHAGGVQVSGNGLRLDSALFSKAWGWPASATGAVNVSVVLDLPGRRGGQRTDAANGTFSIVFPDGGSVNGELSRKLTAALSKSDLMTGLIRNTLPFNSASIEGIAAVDGIALKIEGRNENSSIGGDLRIAAATHAVTGALALRADSENNDNAAAGAVSQASGALTKIVLSGTVAALNFSPFTPHSMSN